MNGGINVSQALDAIHAPTLVIGRSDDVDFPIEQTRDLAGRIAGAVRRASRR